MRVLVVDDIVVNRIIIKGILAKLGHTYAEADNGKSAIELIKKDKFDLVFMDIEMPVMNGIETAKYIKQNMMAENPTLKIFALTAYSTSVLHESFDTSCFDMVVTKPYSMDKIDRVLKSVHI